MNRWFEDGRLRFAVGIEDTFVPQESAGHRKLDEYELTQHYAQWREDLDRAADAGAELIRWGIPWYLVEPAPGDFRWEWLDEVVAHMDRLGLRCVVDLMHYGTPLWLDNQFLNSEYPERVAAYAAAVAERYRGSLTDWTPLNEPVINAVYCGEKGLWPPCLRGDDGFVKLIVQLARGMVLTQRRIAEVQPEAVFVHVDAGFRWVGETTQTAPLEHLLERRFVGLDLVLGRIDDGHPMHGYLTRHGTTDQDLRWFRDNAVTPDVIGVNYYPAFTTSRFEPATGTEHPVEAGTEGLTDLLHTYAARYDRPLLVTETSRGGPASERLAWLEESVALVHRLRASGMDLIGYTWFPFFALVDWLYRESDDPADHWLVQMGLYDLERDAGNTLRRRPTPVVDRFRELAREVRAEADAGGR
ncbi:family 1 glycosylhydrolase [Streptomyces sp. WMMB 322]|uniref:family 1 glycosylhydrolase n=1 Tax=Streptomyces sp. WMMB 322 TaxID=1286821 RepID=UPI0006E28299|nr:family 1 glycosylhydrolase [Streptomyces sp. WMMB 322]SCK30945.1 Beta-glucosidase/6-phospho-beta-glucosidase/beta-galactosidase [Streptomyces sp. WMMB 322]